MEIATDLIYIVLAALIGGIIAQIFRQPLVLGYILAGIFVGPNTDGVTIERVHDIEKLAEIGVALLLFTLGLEFSFGELKRLAKITFLGTPLQIILCSIVSYYIARMLGLSTNDAIWIGAATSLSSTMVVLKTLAANDTADSDAGRISLTILIAQDLAVVPLMLILPELTSESIDYFAIGFALLKSGFFLGFMFVAGTWLFPRIFSLIARWGSRELFFLVTLGVALGTGLATYHLGLSLALGAFVAGMLLSETDFNHQALSDVASLRDLFGLIFFVSVGMLFEPRFLYDHLSLVLLLAGLLILSKAIILGGVIRLFGYGGPKACKVGFGLSQIGEFAFVIANAGSQSGSLSRDSYSLMLSVAVVSMVATPGLFWIGGVLARRITANQKQPEAESINATASLENHVVIVGGGVVGQFVARVLATLESPYVVIDSDYKTVTQMRDQGLKVAFGDGSHRTILESVQIDRARLVVVATTNDHLLPLVMREVSQLSPGVPVVVRVEELDDIDVSKLSGVHELVQPQLEVGIEMVRQSLLALGMREMEILSVLGKLRVGGYRPGRSGVVLSPTDLVQLRAARLLEFGWIKSEDSSVLAGHTLVDLKLRERFGISIVAVIRHEEVSPSPGPQFVIKNGDVLGVLGTPMQIEVMRRELLLNS